MLQDYVEKLKKKCQANHPISLSYLWANAVELLYLREPFGKNSLLQLHLHRQCGRCLGLKFQRHRSKNVTVWSGRLIFFSFSQCTIGRSFIETEKAKREEAERRVLEVQLHAQKSSSSGKAGWRAYFELKRTL